MYKRVSRFCTLNLPVQFINYYVFNMGTVNILLLKKKDKKREENIPFIEWSINATQAHQPVHHHKFLYYQFYGIKVFSCIYTF